MGTPACSAKTKSAVAWRSETYKLRAGQFDAEGSFEHWLLKFDNVGVDNLLDAVKDYDRIEYEYYLMALDAAIHMSECRLLEKNG
jgi:serine/threonine-protein kinase HipA